jgi:hypothetical protein
MKPKPKKMNRVAELVERHIARTDQRPNHDPDGLRLGILYVAITVFEVLPPADDDPTEAWSPVREAERRLNAVKLLRRTAGVIGYSAPSAPIEAKPICDALEELHDFLAQVLVVAGKLEEAMELTDVRLDPRVPGGGKVVTRERGRPPTLLSNTVKRVLQRRYPEWDGDSCFPEENTAELREWLHDELRFGLTESNTRTRVLDHPLLQSLVGPPFFAESRNPSGWIFFGFNTNPLAVNEIDVKSRGLLWSIINNLQRLQ